MKYSPLLTNLIQATPYHSYTYSYPHKTAYRTLTPSLPLQDLWQAEDRDHLFLYLHIPFCSMRCGFCNLFTLSRPKAELQTAYVQKMRNQIAIYSEVLGKQAHFSSAAIGGGTPSYLTVAELTSLLEDCQHLLGIDFSTIPSGIEVSPETVTQAKMQLFREAGLQRISMGIQSFFTQEIDALVRKQDIDTIRYAVDTIRSFDFPTLNLDFIYGIAGQTPERFLESLQAAVSLEPEELYLYPLYVRPQTGLGRISPEKARIPVIQLQAEDYRYTMYTLACEYLQAQGYVQHSMRMFKKSSAPIVFSDYRCQTDGMVGIGCGARSYTRSVHYSEEYGVARAKVSDILQAYCDRPNEEFYYARYGFQLNEREQKTRFLIQSLLNQEGLSLADYAARFQGNAPLQDFPQLTQLFETSLATASSTHYLLTPLGLSYSDAIGPWLYSENVQSLSAAYAFL